MYLGSRMIAEGGSLVGVEEIIIHEDVQIPGETVDSVTRLPRLSPCPIEERPLPLNQHGRLVVDAIIPYTDPTDRDRNVRTVITQSYSFPYPLNVVEYRAIQSWKYAIGIVLGMRPRNTLQGIEMSRYTRSLLLLIFVGATLGALLVPIPLFRRIQPALFSFAKRMFARTSS